MPEVVANTSPLQYLFQLGLLDLLPQLYGEILVPEGVVRELGNGSAAGLGIGEREVLALAVELELAHEAEVHPAPQ